MGVAPSKVSPTSSPYAPSPALTELARLCVERGAGCGGVARRNGDLDFKGRLQQEQAST
jgi:hypothetical protein